MKRFLALSLAVMMLLMVGCTAGSSGNNTESQTNSTAPATPTTVNDQTPEPTKLFDELTEISMLLISNPAYPFQEDWYVMKMLEDKCNVKLNVTPVLSAGYNDRISLDLASGEYADIINVTNTTITHREGPLGAFVNIKDHLDNLPNYKAFYENNKADVARFYTAEGNWYNFHNTGIGETNRQAWLYRKDIFEKHNLKVPTNSDELYSVSKELKALYPESTPFLLRRLFNTEQWAPAWGTGWEFYFNFNTNDWRYGCYEDGFKDMAMFLKKMTEEQLMPIDWLSMAGAGYTEIITTGRAFVMLYYICEIDYMNSLGKETDPNFELAFMPQMLGNDSGVAKYNYSATSTSGFAVNATSKKMKEALKLMDWYYSDEGSELLSWGEEGKTYATVDGIRKYIGAGDILSVRKQYGLATNGFYTRYDFNAFTAGYSEEMKAAVSESQKYDLPIKPAAPFTQEETETYIQTMGTQLKDAQDEKLSRMILGELSFDQWDGFVKEMKDLGADKIVEAYQKAYDRVK